jgi:glycosyltransferase involved in cell wall biosynthesis
MPLGSKTLNIIYVGMLPPHPGGSGISWSQILRGLANSGHRIRAIAPIIEKDLLPSDVFAVAHPQLEIDRFIVPNYYTAPNIVATDSYIQLEQQEINTKLTKSILQDFPDVILIGRESFVLHVPDIARKYHIPTVLGVRGNTTLAILRKTFDEALIQRFLQQYKKVNLLVSVAAHMAEGLRNLGFDNVQVIPNAVDVKQFSPGSKNKQLMEKLSLGKDQIVVAHISNLKSAKRPLDIVHSAVKVLQNNPGLVYLIVGDGAYKEEMEYLCKKNHLENSFRFVGWVDNQLIPDYMNLADIVISSSETEGFSRVYLETQAAGKVLLASDIDPAREAITDRVNGVLFEKGNIDELASKVIELAENQQLRRMIADNALQHVQKHDISHAVAAYDELLRTVC